MNKDKDDIELKLSIGQMQPKQLSNLYEFYLSGEILSSDNYTSWFDTIRHASPEDVVKIYINSYGGDLFTAIQFIRVVAETQATVICSVEGSCMSAATMIFLCADSFEVTPHSVFMFHNYSGGVIGKGGEMIDQLLHERKWSENLLREIYNNFLSEEEINHILNNKDYWMDGQEVVTRIEKRIALLEKAQKSAEKNDKESKIKARKTVRRRK